MKVATREAYGKTLAALAKENKNIIVLDADLSACRDFRSWNSSDSYYGASAHRIP